MSIWGYKIFENDDAKDCLYEMMESDIREYMNESFELASDSDYLEIESCYRIIVAAAVIDISLNKTKYDDIDIKEFETWVDEIGEVELESLIIPAAKGLDSVLGDDSELKELWEEDVTQYDNWVDTISDLLARLK